MALIFIIFFLHLNAYFSDSSAEGSHIDYKFP